MRYAGICRERTQQTHLGEKGSASSLHMAPVRLQLVSSSSNLERYTPLTAMYNVISTKRTNVKTSAEWTKCYG